jgi:hypothetical protein
MATKYHTYHVEGISGDGQPVSRRYVSLPPEDNGGFIAVLSAREQGIHPTKCVNLGPRNDLPEPKLS